MINELHTYFSNTGIVTSGYQFSATENDNPFTVTTTYSFPSSNLSSHDNLSTTISDAESKTKLTNLTVQDTSIDGLRWCNKNSSIRLRKLM